MAIRASEVTAVRPARFNPELQRRTCEDLSVGYLQSFHFNEQSPMGMASASQISDFVYCGLLGLLDRVKPLIPLRAHP